MRAEKALGYHAYSRNVPCPMSCSREFQEKRQWIRDSVGELQIVTAGRTVVIQR